AHVNGFLGCNLIALICNNDSATFCATSFISFMAQIYKIYMNQSALVIADYIPENRPDIQSIDHQYLDIEKLFKQTKTNSTVTTYFVQIKNPRDYFAAIKEKFRVIKAAGGLVKNGEGDYLFIFRL